MNIAEYQTISGIVVPATRQAFVSAQILRTQRILETMLGFSLDETLAEENQYAESGKTQTECPCPSTTQTLDPADAVVTAYRLFSYNKKDQFLSIDPASAINAVKLVNGLVTYRTFEADEYRPHYQHGFIKALEKIVCCWQLCDCNCDGLQLAVDADWLWNDEDNIPDDLKYVWADMVTYYSDNKKDLKSETLGPHSYTRMNRGEPELLDGNMATIKKYAGPNGSVKRTMTL